jgi:hypothetical protein
LVKLNKQLTQQLETVVEELNQIKQERREKEIRKQTHANRKRLPKRDPMTAEIYKELIKGINEGNIRSLVNPLIPLYYILRTMSDWYTGTLKP